MSKTRWSADASLLYLCNLLRFFQGHTDSFQVSVNDDTRPESYRYDLGRSARGYVIRVGWRRLTSGSSTWDELKSLRCYKNRHLLTLNENGSFSWSSWLSLYGNCFPLYTCFSSLEPFIRVMCPIHSYVYDKVQLFQQCLLHFGLCPSLWWPVIALEAWRTQTYRMVTKLTYLAAVCKMLLNLVLRFGYYAL